MAREEAGPYGSGPEFVRPRVTRRQRSRGLHRPSLSRGSLVERGVFRLPPAPVESAHLARHERGLIGPGAPAQSPAALAYSGTLVRRLTARLACRARLRHCWHRTPPAWYSSIPGRTYCCECPASTEWDPSSDCRICTGPGCGVAP